MGQTRTAWASRVWLVGGERTWVGLSDMRPLNSSALLCPGAPPCRVAQMVSKAWALPQAAWLRIVQPARPIERLSRAGMRWAPRLATASASLAGALWPLQQVKGTEAKEAQ